MIATNVCVQLTLHYCLSPLHTTLHKINLLDLLAERRLRHLESWRKMGGFLFLVPGRSVRSIFLAYWIQYARFIFIETQFCNDWSWFPRVVFLRATRWDAMHSFKLHIRRLFFRHFKFISKQFSKDLFDVTEAAFGFIFSDIKKLDVVSSRLSF